MSSPFDEWFRIRRPKFWFSDIDAMMQEMERMMQDALKSAEQMPKGLVKERKLEDGSIVREMGPIVYGYSVKIGEDGKPVIRKFGNIDAFPSMIGGKFDIRDEREPVIDVIKGAEEIKVVAEIPGVNKEDLRLTCNEKTLTIESMTGERRYHKKVDLPDEIDPRTAKSTYKNGILEVILKRKSKQDSGISINIE